MKNTWAIFSRNFENIIQDNYSVDSIKYCNFAYIKGEISINSEPDADGYVTTSKKRVEKIINRIKPGEERRELYVDARDLQSEDSSSDSDY